MTADERELIEGNPNAVPPIPSMLGLIRHHIGQVNKRCRNEADNVSSIAYEAACEAAMTFDPANEIQFTTYLKSRLLYECTARKAIAESHGDLAARYEDGDEQERSGKRVRFEKLLETEVVAPAVNDERPAEELNAALKRAGISPREREILLLRFGHGQSLAQISRRFGIPLKGIGEMIQGLVERVSSGRCPLLSLDRKSTP